MRNKHHVLFPKVLHEATKVGKDTRETRLLIPTMDADIHTELHKEIQIVPVLNHYMASHVLYLMQGSEANTSLQAMDDYMRAVEESMEHPKVNDLDRKLGEIVLESIDRQNRSLEIRTDY